MPGTTSCLFGGEHLDSDTQTYVLRSRYYSAQQGRFGGLDDYEAAPDDDERLNGYAFTENNPTNFVDPTGYAPIEYLLWGVAIHTYLGLHFKDIARGNPGKHAREANMSIKKLLRLQGKFYTFMLRPDLTDLTYKEVFEIKSGMNLLSKLEGAYQNWGYVLSLNNMDPSGAWHFGSSSTYTTPMQPVSVPGVPLPVEFDQPDSNGVILYYVGGRDLTKGLYFAGAGLMTIAAMSRLVAADRIRQGLAVMAEGAMGSFSLGF